MYATCPGCGNDSKIINKNKIQCIFICIHCGYTLNFHNAYKNEMAEEIPEDAAPVPQICPHCENELDVEECWANFNMTKTGKIVYCQTCGFFQEFNDEQFVINESDEFWDESAIDISLVELKLNRTLVLAFLQREYPDDFETIWEGETEPE